MTKPEQVNSGIGKAGPGQPSRELVTLDRDHPGFRDVEYRRRRNIIAQLAMDHREGESIPTVQYTSAEEEVWREVWSHLAPLLEKHACSSYLASLQEVAINRLQIPQLEDVNQALAKLSGFKMAPVAGLVKPEVFLTCLDRNIFLSTQYMRHPSTPLYTPEPDVVHELVGHAAYFADPLVVKLNRAFGTACMRASSPAVIEKLIRVYWYTLEFGLVHENGELKAYGAGILSSFGELGRSMSHSNLRPFHVEEVCQTPFDPTNYQDVLFVVSSMDELEATLLGWFGGLSPEKR